MKSVYKIHQCSGTTTLILLLVTATASATRAGATNRVGMEHPYLRGVRIEMKDGHRLVGYVGWSRDYFKYDKEPKFPQSLIDPTAWVEESNPLELELYTKLYPVSKEVLRRAFPGGTNMRMVIASASDTLTLPIKQIASIRALRMKYDGIEATIDGMITDIRSRTIIRLLMNGKPFATLKNDDHGYVLVSFNRRIGRRKLVAISGALTRQSTGEGIPANPEKAWEQTFRRLQRQRVVVIQYITVD